MKTTIITTKNFTTQLNSYVSKRDTMQALLEFAYNQYEQGSVDYFNKIRLTVNEVRGINADKINHFILECGLRWNSKTSSYAKDKGRPQGLPTRKWYDNANDTTMHNSLTGAEWLEKYKGTVLKQLISHGVTVSDLIKELQAMQVPAIAPKVEVE